MSKRKGSLTVLGRQAETRFWSRVERRGPANCWPWIGATSRDGYGRFKLGGRVVYAHRLAYSLEHGDAGERDILHTCGNSACCNPEHLVVAPAGDNGHSGRPKKPREDFPLFPHASGRWAKKVRGRVCYFGRVADDPKGEAALGEWNRSRADLLAGRPAADDGAGLTLAALVNEYLTSKQRLVASGELTERTFEDYHRSCGMLIRCLGRSTLVGELRPQDFERLRFDLAKVCGAVRLTNEIQRTRSVFKYGWEMDLIGRPVKFGPTFRAPRQRVIRLERERKGKKLFTAEQIRALLDASSRPLRAMVLLAVNAGLGNADVGRLEWRHLEGCWLDYPREKTGVPRRAWLWPETLAAIAEGGTDKGRDGLVFLTVRGEPWYKTSPTSPVSQEFTKRLKKLKYHRPGLGFYTMRHVFATVAGETLDQAAVDVVMGHAPAREDMAARYRQRVGDDRITRVCEHVRTWLFGAEGGAR